MSRVRFVVLVSAAAIVAAIAAALGVEWLTDDPPPARGELIAYGCKEQHNAWYAICVIRSDGTESHRLTSRVPATNPTWSPDGRRIAFTRREDVGEFSTVSEDDVFVMNADGGNSRQLTADRRGKHAGQPAWSPDGSQIAFVSGRSVPSALIVRPGDLFVMKADGSEVRRLTRGWVDATPAFSPDGRELVFSRSKSFDSPSRGLWVMDVAGGSPRELTRTADSLDGAPAWSPDGSRIAFVRLRRESAYDGAAALYVVNRDGTHLRKVIDYRYFSFFSYPVAWSPGGRTIAFETSPSRLCTAISLVDVASRRVRPLTSCTRPRESSLSPAWQPDTTAGAP